MIPPRRNDTVWIPILNIYLFELHVDVFLSELQVLLMWQKLSVRIDDLCWGVGEQGRRCGRGQGDGPPAQQTPSCFFLF